MQSNRKKTSQIKPRLRCERKYTIDSSDLIDLTPFILTNPTGFVEEYPKRQVNSLYFDTPTLEHCQASLRGDFHRIKPRIRWYGENTKKITLAQLEFKVKEGELGYKRVAGLKRAKINLNKKPLRQKYILKKIQKQVPKEMLIHLRELIPVLITSYQREYFISADRKVRLTVDTDLNYTLFHNQPDRMINDPKTVVEIKYLPEHERKAREITKHLPLILYKMSKYASGVEFLG